MKNRIYKFLSVITCLLVCLPILCVSAGAEVKTSTSGVHTAIQKGTDGKEYVTVVKDPGPQITIDETHIAGTQDRMFNGEKIGTKDWYLQFEGYLSEVDTKNKCIYINYGGNLYNLENVGALKNQGIKILNPKGAEIYYWSCDKSYTLKIPYSDISFVKEMYIVYGSQKVKMTVA